VAQRVDAKAVLVGKLRAHLHINVSFVVLIVIIGHGLVFLVIQVRKGVMARLQWVASSINLVQLGGFDKSR
jgi:hypothetical protein